MAKSKSKEKVSKSTRRGNGEGSIFQRNDGRWVAQIQTGTDSEGKKILKTFYGKERKDVAAKLKEFQLNQLQGYDCLSTVNLKDYINNWFALTKTNQLKPSSLDRLESTIDNHIIPNIGHYTIDKLTSQIIQKELINKMIDDKMSYSSIKKAYDAINACMKYAVKNRQLMFNPVDTVAKPSTTKFKKKEIIIFSEEEKQRFEDTCILKYSNSEYIYKTGYGFILILYTGLRMGEALALKWVDVDFINKKIKIDNNIVMAKNRKKEKETDPNIILIEQDTTKTKKGVRYVGLSKKAFNALEQLKRMKYYNPDGYVFTTENNTPIRPRNLQNTFDSILTKANINHVGLHALRHTFASMLFKKGIDIKTVSEILGHADVRTTYNTYIHLIEEQKKNAIDVLDDI
jgi:integrase